MVSPLRVVEPKRETTRLRRRPKARQEDVQQGIGEQAEDEQAAEHAVVVKGKGQEPGRPGRVILGRPGRARFAQYAQQRQQGAPGGKEDDQMMKLIFIRPLSFLCWGLPERGAALLTGESEFQNRR